MRSMVALAWVFVASAGAACGPSGSQPVGSPSPTPAQNRSAEPAVGSPSPLPGSVVKLTVNGKSYPVSGPVRASGDLPTVVVLAFPFAVDRPGLERWLPAEATKAWTDDQTLELSFAKADTSIGFKVPETRSATGGASIGQFTVDITFPEARLIRIYTIADLMSDRVPEPSVAVRAPRGDGLTVSRDGRTAIVYDGFGFDTGPSPVLFDVNSGVVTRIELSAPSEHWFSFADWLPDGRLALVGRSVWVGDGNGTSMRRIADAEAAVGGYPWFAVPDPAGTRLALWGYNVDGHIAVIDLLDGSVQRITGPFRRQCEDCGNALAWSSDGTRIAGTDSDSEAGGSARRVRVVDVVADRTVRTMEGDVLGLAALGDDELVVIQRSGETGAGARNLGLRVDFDLSQKGRYLGCGWWESPDGRYLLQAECGGAGMRGYALVDLRTGASHAFGLEGPSEPRWLSDGRLAAY